MDNGNLSTTDREALRRWIVGGASLREVETSQIGLVGNVRYSQRVIDVFRFLWLWSAPRFSGEYGAAQERVYRKGGMAALERRKAKVDRIIARLACNDK